LTPESGRWSTEKGKERRLNSRREDLAEKMGDDGGCREEGIPENSTFGDSHRMRKASLMEGLKSEGRTGIPG